VVGARAVEHRDEAKHAEHAIEAILPGDPWIVRWEGWVLGQSDMPAGV
jgi:hypothetical protein